jgi:hypothetical protein
MPVTQRAVDLFVVGPVVPVADHAREVAVVPRGADVGGPSARTWCEAG